MTATRRNELLTAAVLLGVTLGAFLAGEAVLRLHAGQDEARPVAHLPPASMPKPLGTFRLAFLGASTTMSSYVTPAQQWPGLVTSHLAASLEGCTVDHATITRAGANLPTLASLYEKAAARLMPDVVLVTPTNLSHDLEAEASRAGIDVNQNAYRSPLADHSRLLDKLELNLRIAKLQRAAFRPSELDVPVDAVAARYADGLADLLERMAKADARSDPALPVLVEPAERLRPDMNRSELVEAAGTRLFYTHYVNVPDLVTTMQAHAAALADAGRAASVPVIGGGDEVPADARHYVDATHLTDAGARANAARLVPRLLASKPFVARAAAAGCRVRERHVRDGHALKRNS